MLEEVRAEVRASVVEERRIEASVGSGGEVIGARPERTDVSWLERVGEESKGDDIDMQH